MNDPKETRPTPELVGHTIEVLAYGHDKKNGTIKKYRISGELVHCSDGVVVIQCPDEPPVTLPGRKGKRYLIKADNIEETFAREDLDQVRIEAFKGNLRLHLEGANGSRAFFSKIGDLRTKAEIFDVDRESVNPWAGARILHRELYASNPGELLHELEEMGFRITSWGAL